MKFFVQTFGCQMNVADSEEMSRHLFQYGYTPASSPEEADLLLLNNKRRIGRSPLLDVSKSGKIRIPRERS
ncbi:MAG: hypothetical protein HYY63_01520 [Elusimicrobia bacterium]|nr:hypothetical protein [Elusimicrobiota bacterium]